MTDAVMTSRTGYSALLHNLLRYFQKLLLLLIRQRLFLLEGTDILFQLLHIGHAGKNHGHLGDGLEETEGPGRNRLIRAESFQFLLIFLGKLCQAPASYRLNYTYRQMIPTSQLRLFLRVLEFPVRVVEINLADSPLLHVSL